MIVQLSYSFHIGSDANKTTKAKQRSKELPSNFNNNSIQNSIQLSKVNHHNLRMYDKKIELINIIRGSNDIVNDIKNLYLKEFEEARIEYNNKQARNDRKIDNYFNHISKDTKHDLAVEIIIELGNMYYWEDKTLEEKYKMKEVFKNQVDLLEKNLPKFKIGNATIHFDEASPHLHIVGLAVKENCKTGMKKQVGKTSVFTIDSLSNLQDKMRKVCINDFNKIYGINAVLKEKEQGRNRNYRVNQMKDYESLVDNFNKQRKKINKINESNMKLNNESDKIKDIITNLKPHPLFKNNSIISKENKQLLLDYIDNIKIVNKSVKEITNYSLSVEKIKEDFEDNYSTIDNLNFTIKEQKQEIADLKDKIETKENLIQTLNHNIYNLSMEVNKWKKKFNKIIDFIKNKVLGIFNNKDQEFYKDMANNMFINNAIDKEDYNTIIDRNEKHRDNNLER